HFGTQTKHTNITFVSEAEIENIYGKTSSASGTTWIDFDAGKGKANIKVPVKDLDTGIELRNEHLRSETWLDEKQFPDIKFASDGFDVKEKNKDKGLFEAKVKGKFTLHGVTKDIETTAKVARLSKEMSAKIGDGDWVRITATFEVTIADYGIKIPNEQVAP